VANIRAEKAPGQSLPAGLEESLFEEAFEGAPHAMAVLAPDGSVTRANRSLCAMLDFTRAELEAMSCAHLIHPDDLPTECQQRRRLAAADIGRYELVVRCVRKDGAPIWVRLAVSATPRMRGKPANLIAAIEAVPSPTARIQSSGHDKWPHQFGDATLAAVHEIGNCLTPLMVNIEMILEQAGKKELRESAHQIFKSARRIAFTLRRLRGLDDPPAVAYVGEQRMLDLRLLAPPRDEANPPPTGSP